MAAQLRQVKVILEDIGTILSGGGWDARYIPLSLYSFGQNNVMHLSVEQWTGLGGLAIAGGYPIIKAVAARILKTEIYWRKVDDIENIIHGDARKHSETADAE